jgi:murein DD-endopeptidase MepM/ murein hydrolase activator NlpD
MGGRQWLPRDGTCWYPVDLLATGRIELERWRSGQYETRSLPVADYPYDVQRIQIEDESRVHLSAENQERAARESARIRQLWPREGTSRFELPLGSPLAELPSGGRFGARRIINGEPRSPHTGVDYSASTGDPILAVAGGEVVLAEEHFFGGNSVFVDHGDGLISMYFHMSRIDVAKGEVVDRGQTMGAVGATGRATGPHLHFGLRWHGLRIDPALLLGDPSDVPEIE